ncbi:DUF4097 domain-containing protein [Paenibacillus sp. P96]|uniref:DUF4097 domain-containing protein n=1 Tax=Paenibacillus zeirhizosphaerae TaxID=2987519 RepID=A0ABT9FTP6_9BACL|nr:DUF4097 family beta strand repeat-containing protein [Paenibacillus sp. P96]MDP4098099.1 DUF4097 domain-containing protein [Paenibacillus sp. P96]
MHRKVRVGRYTASLLLLFVGILLCIDLVQDTDYMMGLLTWWPLLFVGLGLEYFLFSWLYLRRSGASKGRRLFRADLKGLLMSVLLCASVFIITQQEHYMYLWNRVSLNLTTASMDFSEEEGNRINKGSVLVPVGMQTSELLVEGVNGDITVRRAAVQDVEIHTTMWIDQVTVEEAKSIAEASSLEASNGNTIRIWTSAQSYGASGKRQPRMNMEIVLPEDRRVDMDIRTSNGEISLTGVDAIHSISLQSGNGNLAVSGVIGDVRGTTLNGTIDVHGVTGNVEMNTNRGNVLAGDISGSTVLNTLVGSIQVARTEGDVTADTKNGNIGINNASWNVNASSLNGGIAVQSNSIGGNWNIYSAVGNITLRLPVLGSFRLEGSSSYGDINADAPFEVDGKNVSGQVGDGLYSLLVEGNSDLTVHSSELTQSEEETGTPR